MTSLYTTEKNVLILIALLKANNIKNVIASPGTTNCAFIGSIQNDSFFNIFSSVDERSAAYMACGIAAETGEPVVISCTGATASRNYLPGLTEAFYRKLPVLAITSMQILSKVGHHVAQVIDRSVIQKDVAKHSVALPVVKDNDDYWDCEVKVNTAILELTRHGGGPVHINLPTTYSLPFSIKELPQPRVMQRFTSHVELPTLQGKVAVFVGSHKTWQTHEIEALETFCTAYNAVVFCDHTSGYHGQYRVQFSIVAAQELLSNNAYKPDVLVHIGEITGDYPLLSMAGKQVWRVSEDGEIRDTFRRLTNVFEMPEYVFFRRYAQQNTVTPVSNNYLTDCQNIISQVRRKIPELPFSNIWLASQIAHKLPVNSVIHFGILNSLRTWNFFDLPPSVTSASNVGGFGIDGIISTIIGASLVNPERLYFSVLGDLAFFYDMNAIGNRHVGNNLRILMVNNGKGTEFRQYNHHASYFGDAADEFVAAAGHYGNQSPTLVKDYAENLGFEYISAKNKAEFEKVYQQFISSKLTNNKSVVFEVFTNSQDESDALAMMHSIEQSKSSKAKQITKQLLGQRGIRLLRKLLKS